MKTLIFAVLQIIKNQHVLFSPIIKHDVIRNPDAHICSYSIALDYIDDKKKGVVLPTPRVVIALSPVMLLNRQTKL